MSLTEPLAPEEMSAGGRQCSSAASLSRVTKVGRDNRLQERNPSPVLQETVLPKITVPTPVLQDFGTPRFCEEYGTPVLQDYGTPGSARSRYPWFCVITVPLVVYGTSPTHSPLAGGSPLTNDTARQPGYGADSCPRRHAHAPRVVCRRLSRITVVGSDGIR